MLHAFDGEVMIYAFDDFAGLKRHVDKHYYGVNGYPSDRADTGEEYVELKAYGLCRSADSDRAIVERFVVAAFSHQLNDYLARRKGEVYWRIRLEEDWIDSPQVVRYAADGPDYDVWTGRKCYLDRDWKRYNIYCRLLRSDKPVLAVAS